MSRARPGRVRTPATAPVRTVRTDVGEVSIDVPRDRAGTFTPVVVPKHSRRLAGFDAAVISLYAMGLTTGDLTPVWWSSCCESPIPDDGAEEDSIDMAKRRRHTPEQVIRNLREGERLLGEGQELTAVCKHLGQRADLAPVAPAVPGRPVVP